MPWSNVWQSRCGEIYQSPCGEFGQSGGLGPIYVSLGLKTGPLPQASVVRVTQSGSEATIVSGLANGWTNIVLDSHGNLFGADLGGTLYKQTPSGTRTNFATITSSSNYQFLAIDHDDNIYANPATNVFPPAPIQQITPSGSVSTFATIGYPTPSSSSSSYSAQILLGAMWCDASNNLYCCWFDNDGFDELSRIDMITPSAVVSQYATLGGQSVQGLTGDSAGNLYFGYETGGDIYQVPPGGGSFSSWVPLGSINGLTVDPDDNIYAIGIGSLYKITPAKVVTTILSSPGNSMGIYYSDANQ
jgi:hypothetical protein